jgi:protein-disulfide isomerase
MKTLRAVAAALAFGLLGLLAGTGRAQTAPDNPPVAVKPAGSASTAEQTPLQKSIDAYLRNLYAFGPEVQLTVSVPKETPIAGLLETSVSVKTGEGAEDAKFYVSKDGKYLIRGDVLELSNDPMVANRAAIDLTDAPVMGNPKAAITVVEFSDFECPVCRSLHDVMRGMMKNYPQVRVVFKDYPIEVLHPWARTAALAGRCAYQQEPAAFWKMYDSIYDNQEIISAENAWMKMAEYAGRAGLNPDAFRACMASPEAGAAVDASRANGQKLDVNSTPTLFVNGRRLVGADPHLLQQYIQYEIGQLKAAKSADRK